MSFLSCSLGRLAVWCSALILGMPLAAIASPKPEMMSAISAAPVAYPTTADGLVLAQGTSPSMDGKPYRRDGFYLTLLGSPIQSRKFAQDFIGRATFTDGSASGGAIGYRWGDFRFEGEIQYFSNGFDLLTFLDQATGQFIFPSQRSPGATVDGRSIMFNIYYDYPLSERWRPYLGLGAGFYRAQINGLSPEGFGGFVAFGESPDRFAYQLRLGIAYAVDANFEILAGFRYFKGDTFEYTIRSSTSLTPDGSLLVLRPNGLETQSIELGIRYHF